MIKLENSHRKIILSVLAGLMILVGIVAIVVSVVSAHMLFTRNPEESVFMVKVVVILMLVIGIAFAGFGIRYIVTQSQAMEREVLTGSSIILGGLLGERIDMFNYLGAISEFLPIFMIFLVYFIFVKTLRTTSAKT